MLLAGLSAWLAVRLSIFFITYSTTVTAEAIAIVATYFLGFLMGTFALPARFVRGAPPESRFPGKYGRVAVVLFSISALFLVLRIYDLLFVRGLWEIGDIQATRAEDLAQIEGRTTGGISFISGLGYSIAVPVFVFTIAFQRFLSKRLYVTGFLVFSIYCAYVFFSGSRYLLIGPLTFAIIAYAFANRGIKLSRGKLLALVAICGALFWFFTMGSLSRDVKFGAADSAEALAIAPYRQLFSADPWFQSWFQRQNDAVQAIFWGWVNYAWYVTHGAYEFQKLVDFSDPTVHSYGVAQFSMVFYFLRVMGLPLADDSVWVAQLPNAGLYNTFFGPVYTDFGWIGGGIYMFIVGITVQYCWSWARRGGDGSLLFYPFLASMVFNMFMNNLIQNGNGVPIMALTATVIVLVKSFNHLQGLGRLGNALKPAGFSKPAFKQP